jgi:hypothetical protein
MRCSPTVVSHTKVISCLLLSWLFLATSVVPTAKTGGIGLAKKSKSLQQNQVSARRENELLVRFRGVQGEQQKNLVATSHGLRRQKTLRGQSGIEKLQLVSASKRCRDSRIAQFQLEPAATRSVRPRRDGSGPYPLLQLARLDQRWCIHEVQCRSR